MLTHISWQQYSAFLLVAISLYYLVVWILILKMKLPSFKFLLQRLKSTATQQYKEQVNSTVLHVIDELTPEFIPGIPRPDLILALQIKLKKYSQWEEPGFRESVNQYITQTSVTKCSIHLSVEDQRVLWNG